MSIVREFRRWHRENWSPSLARNLGWLPVIAAFLCLVTVVGWPFDSGSRMYIPSIFWERETVQEVCQSMSHVPSTHNQQVWIITQEGGKYRWVYGDEVLDQIRPGDEVTISCHANHPFADVPIIRALSVNGQELLNWDDAARQEDEAAMGYIIFLIAAVALSALSYYAAMWRRFRQHRKAAGHEVRGC